MNLLKKGWYPNFIRLITLVYFRRVELYGKENIPARGPVLFIGLHKNGAVDGFVYYRTLAPVEFMLAAQLRRNPIVRLFFDGIEVTRAKDQGVKGNIAALKKCISFLEEGGRLFVFPEGTSTLGPVHLPFKEGAAILASRFNFAQNKQLTVIPCAIFYDDPTHLGGKVEVVAGKPIVFTQTQNRHAIHQLFSRALEEIGIDYANEEQAQLIQKTAACLSMDGKKPYFFFLRKIYDNKALYQQAAEMFRQINHAGLWYYKEVPAFPRSLVTSIWTWCITCPFVCYAFLWNLLPIGVGYFCARKFADDANVISLWKIIPSFSLALIFTAVEIVLFPRLALLSLAVSLLGFIIYGAWKKHTVSLYNWLCWPAGMKKFNKLRGELYEKIIR